MDGNSLNSLLWFQRDLRISDNPALNKAKKFGKILPIYILDPEEIHTLGENSKIWLYYSLEKLNQTLENKLNFYIGNPKNIILNLIQQFNIGKVFWNKCCEPNRNKYEKELTIALKKIKMPHECFNSSYLWEPSSLTKQDKSPYKIFTHYYNNIISIPYRQPSTVKIQNQLMFHTTNKIRLSEVKLIQNKKKADLLKQQWKFGETAATHHLEIFIKNVLPDYQKTRNFLNHQTSRLSTYLAFGEISPNQILSKIYPYQNKYRESTTTFIKQIVWREFAHYTISHFPSLPHKNMRKNFDNFPWKKNTKLLTAWKHGKTGYPIIDAGMHELLLTGYMHNRVRMIVGSFLVKNLLIHWHEGRDWFWENLVDADTASNSMNWQWVAGSGIDSSPYFRVFNPILQGEKFDTEGEYVKKFVPELKKLEKKYLFKPWTAPEHILDKAGISLGETYPFPIVDIKTSRENALNSYKMSKQLNK